MLHTYIHHKEYSGASWDVAHIYEHLVTRSFHAYLESLNIHPGFIGHISGDTFERIIFLNATFYSQQIADAYKHFLAKSELVDISFVPQMLLECETEEKVIFTLQDKVKFNEQLRTLVAEPWVNNDSVPQSFINETTNPEILLQVKRAAKEFRDVSVGVYVDVNDLDNEEQVLFLRLSALIGDVIGYVIRKELHGSYYIASSPISKDTNIMGSTHHIRFQQSTSLKSVQEIAEAAINDIDVQSVTPLVLAQFEEFSDRATWRTFVIDYYRHTGIVTNTAFIASLATLERIGAILSKVKIHVRPIQKSDKEHLS
ncbi:MAG TPA: hypothetical protein VK497_02230 [Candidatus Saccharimonadales bacterium]|nr:hypothetical protein [Candidatus Saccharimonadales bacterium]